MRSTQIPLWDDRDTGLLTTYLLDATPTVSDAGKRPAVLILPGGAYLYTSDREAEPVALRFAAQGFHAFVLRYATYYKHFREDGLPPVVDEQYAFPQPLLDAGKAVMMLRERAEEWQIDPARIYVCGFSAGGHLAASLGVFWRQSFLCDALGTTAGNVRPDGLILAYAPLDYVHMAESMGEVSNEAVKQTWTMVSQALFGTANPTREALERWSPVLHVTADTPRTFLWHTGEDELVPAVNSLLFAQALAAHKVPYELHLFQKGPHGLSLADETTARPGIPADPHAQTWFDAAVRWMKMT
jgi:acetyl esterase/lipase